jgi:hypothetical protein
VRRRCRRRNRVISPVLRWHWRSTGRPILAACGGDPRPLAGPVNPAWPVRRAVTSRRRSRPRAHPAGRLLVPAPRRTGAAAGRWAACRASPRRGLVRWTGLRAIPIGWATAEPARVLLPAPSCQGGDAGPAARANRRAGKALATMAGHSRRGLPGHGGRPPHVDSPDSPTGAGGRSPAPFFVGCYSCRRARNDHTPGGARFRPRHRGQRIQPGSRCFVAGTTSVAAATSAAALVSEPTDVCRGR